MPGGSAALCGAAAPRGARGAGARSTAQPRAQGRAAGWGGQGALDNERENDLRGKANLYTWLCQQRSRLRGEEQGQKESGT